MKVWSVQFVIGQTDAGKMLATGHYTEGAELIDSVLRHRINRTICFGWIYRKNKNKAPFTADGGNWCFFLLNIHSHVFAYECLSSIYNAQRKAGKQAFYASIFC